MSEQEVGRSGPRAAPPPVPGSHALVTDHRQVRAGILAGTVLAGLVPLFLLLDVADVGRSQAWPVTWLVLVWSGVRLAVLVTSGDRRLFEFFFWLFSYIFLGLAPTVQMRTGELSGTTPGMDPSVDLPTALVVVLGLVAFEVGHLVARRRRAPVPEPTTVGEAAKSASTGRISAARTAALVLVGAALTVLLVSKIGFSGFLASREAALAARQAALPDLAVQSIVTSGALYPLLIAIGALLELRRRSLDPARRRLLAWSTAVCVALVASEVSPVSSARYTFGTVAFAIAVYLGAVRTPVRVRNTMVVTVLAFLFVFPVADAFRRAGGAQFGRQGFFDEYVGSSDYDSFWQIGNALTYSHDGLVEPFRQLSGSLLFWVPRSVWAGKPLDTGVVLAEYRGYTFHNLSAPLWAEALVNGGIGLLVVVFLVLGYVVHRLDAKLVSSAVSGGTWFVVGAVFPVFTTILLRGSLLQATGALAVAVASVVFIRSPARARPPHGP